MTKMQGTLRTLLEWRLVLLLLLFFTAHIFHEHLPLFRGCFRGCLPLLAHIFMIFFFIFTIYTNQDFKNLFLKKWLHPLTANENSILAKINILASFSKYRGRDIMLPLDRFCTLEELQFPSVMCCRSLIF